MIKKIILWILVIACMGTIFYFSSQVAQDSDDTSEGFIFTLVKFFDVQDVYSDAEATEIAVRLNGVVRTLAHFTVYAVLGFFLALLLNEYRRNYPNIIFYSIIISLVYACTDEFHQSFVPGRSAQLSDIITDTLGALCGSVFAVLIVMVIKKYKKKHTA